MSIHLDIHVFNRSACECVEIHCLRKLFALENHIAHRLVCAYKRCLDTHTLSLPLSLAIIKRHGARRLMRFIVEQLHKTATTPTVTVTTAAANWVLLIVVNEIHSLTHSRLNPFSFFVVKNLLAISVCPARCGVALCFAASKIAIYLTPSVRSCLGQCLICIAC